MSLVDLSPMDWVVADAFSIKGSNFLALVDKCSNYVWAQTLKNMEADTIKAVLDKFSNTYSGPPNRKTLDGGDKFGSIYDHRVVHEKWITYGISAVESPEWRS